MILLDWKKVYTNSLKINLEEMYKTSDTPNISYGIGAYDMLIRAIENTCLDDFGLRYCIGIYHERKEAMFLYMQEIREMFGGISKFDNIIESFHITAKLYHDLMFETLKQGTCGWNDLWKPIDKKSYCEIVMKVRDIKSSEVDTLKVIEQFLEEYENIK